MNTTDLGLGTYSATIAVSSDNADNSPQTIPVTYSVVGGPNIVVINDLAHQVRGSTIEMRALITNDRAVQTIVVPLVLRNESGEAFVTAVKPAFRERLALPGGPLTDIVFANHYHSEDGTCKSGKTGGFGTVTYTKDTTSHAVSSSPVAYLFSRGSTLIGDLVQGTDSTGSLLLEVTLNNESGCFVVDTTCTNPANHLLFVDTSNQAVPVSFRFGRVCID